MSGATEQVLSNGHGLESPAEDGNSATPPTEAEVQTIIESIREASSRPTSPSPTTAELTTTTDEFDEGAYWDLPSMAPLNAVSAVSIRAACT